MILLNDFRRQWDDTRDQVMTSFASIAESGWYVLGRRLEDFEASLARCWGVQYVAGVANGMEALEVALTVLGCQRGDRVLTTPLSAFATTLAIVRLGAIPVFVDTDEFGLIDLAACRRVLSERPDIRFLVPVHLYGNALDLNALRGLQDEFEVSVVEDCAQSILATFDGERTGSAGKMAATSFYPTKNLGAMGDGGAVLTNNRSWHDAVKVLRDYGQAAKYQHDRLGFNSRLDEVQAALLNDVYLPKVVQWTGRRAQIAHVYLDGIHHRGIHCLGSPRGSVSCWHLFPVLVNSGQKRDFMDHLHFHGVACGEHYPVLITSQSALKNVVVEVLEPGCTAGRICASEISLPIHPYLTDDEIVRVIDVCNMWKP